MKLPPDIPIYGDISFRGVCASETLEQVTFFNRIRAQYPDTYGAIAIHIRNEGKRHLTQVYHEKAQGMVTGAPDIIIPGKPAFISELKRRDHTKSRITDEQVDYLRAARKLGAFVVIALGVDAAWEALMVYDKITRRL